jgi:hypothetical protein
MIWQCGAIVKLKETYANDRLIRINKFISRVPKNFCNLFYYYCQTLLNFSAKI